MKALSRKLQVLQLLECIENGEHAGDLAKKLQVMDAIHFLILIETIQKWFISYGFETLFHDDIDSAPDEIIETKRRKWCKIRYPLFSGSHWEIRHSMRRTSALYIFTKC